MVRMIGAPPGYVGYEEGGQLSEQVRRRVVQSGLLFFRYQIALDTQHDPFFARFIFVILHEAPRGARHCGERCPAGNPVDGFLFKILVEVVQSGLAIGGTKIPSTFARFMLKMPFCCPQSILLLKDGTKLRSTSRN